MLNFEEEKAITIDLLEEESIQTEVADINYIPSYKVAETERQANEKERIANEEEREAAYNKLTEMIKEGKVTGIYIGEEQPTDVFTEVWIDPNGNPEVEASKIVFSDNETLQTKYENGELKGDKGDTGTDGYTPVKGVDYFTEEDKQSLNIPTKTSELTNDSNFVTESDVSPLIENITGNLSSLNTTDKNSLTNAINELLLNINNLLATEEFQTENSSIDTGATKTFTIDVTKAGYTPIGIVQIDSSSGNTAIHKYSFYGNNAYVTVKNTYSSSVSAMITVKILYKKS